MAPLPNWLLQTVIKPSAKRQSRTGNNHFSLKQTSMTNETLFSTTTQTEEKTYPTPSEIFKKLIESAQKLRETNEKAVKIYLERIEYDPIIWSTPERMVEMTKEFVSDDDADLDEFVYDVISEWDEKFEGDTNWSDEDDSDEKDYLRDFIMNILEEEGVEKATEINKDFLKRETVIDRLNDW